MEKMKRFLSLLLVVLLTAGCLPLSAGAEENNLDSAVPISFGQTVNGSITETKDNSAYKFTLPSSGCLSINFAGDLRYVDVSLYNQDGGHLWDSRYGWNDTTHKISEEPSFDLLAGTYYFCVKGYYLWELYVGDYNFELSFTSSDESFSESQSGPENNFLSSADDITMGKAYRGQIAKNDDKDFYKLSLPTSGCLSLKFTGNLENIVLCIYDKNGQTVWEKRHGWNETTQQIVCEESTDLLAGTYYFCANGYRLWDLYTGNYSFQMGFVSADESFGESQEGNNNSLADADSISLNQNYKGQIAYTEDKDFYKFSLFSAGDVSLQLDCAFEYIDIYLYDSEGNGVWDKRYVHWNDTTKKILVQEKLSLSPGSYYLCLVKRYDCTGNYSFSLSTGNKPVAPAQTPYPGTPFTDINEHWGREAAKWAYEQNLFKGISSSAFGPNNKMDRGMLATVLWRLAGKPQASDGTAFPDVASSSYYAEAVKWASSLKVIKGSGGKFLPKNNITREELATMLYRYAKLDSSPVATGDLARFPDGGKVSNFAKEAMSWAVGEGIINGKSGKLDPKGTATRAEVATMLKRYAS